MSRTRKIPSPTDPSSAISCPRNQVKVTIAIHIGIDKILDVGLSHRDNILPVTKDPKTVCILQPGDGPIAVFTDHQVKISIFVHIHCIDKLRIVKGIVYGFSF